MPTAYKTWQKTKAPLMIYASSCCAKPFWHVLQVRIILVDFIEIVILATLYIETIAVWKRSFWTYVEVENFQSSKGNKQIFASYLRNVTLNHTPSHSNNSS